MCRTTTASPRASACSHGCSRKETPDNSYFRAVGGIGGQHRHAVERVERRVIRSARATLCRQRLQERAEASDRLMDMQAPLDLPYTGRDRLHDRNAEVSLEPSNEVERPQPRSQDVDGIGTWALAKLRPDEGGDGFRRKLENARERHIKAFHGDDADTGILEIFRKAPVEVRRVPRE